MTEKNDTLTGNEGSTSQSHTMQVKVNMQQGEHTGQPIYSNFTSVQIGQGVVIVDFGFLDPQTINSLNQMVRSGEKPSGVISAKMSCRMAISIDAANQLAQQLNQLLNKRTAAQVPIDPQKATDQVNKTPSNTATSDEKSSTPESNQGGFRLPWSKRTH